MCVGKSSVFSLFARARARARAFARAFACAFAPPAFALPSAFALHSAFAPSTPTPALYLVSLVGEVMLVYSFHTFYIFEMSGVCSSYIQCSQFQNSGGVFSFFGFVCNCW